MADGGSSLRTLVFEPPLRLYLVGHLVGMSKMRSFVILARLFVSFTSLLQTYLMSSRRGIQYCTLINWLKCCFITSTVFSD